MREGREGAPLKWIEVERDAIRANVRWVRKRLPPAARLLAVVKADAYGHGAVETARLAVEEGAGALGVLTLAEALELRRAGIAAPLLLLAPPLPDQAPAAVSARLEVTVDSPELSLALSRAAPRRGSPVPVHVDVDFGLRRWGVRPDLALAFAASAASRRGLRLAGLSTHIDYVPGKNAVEAGTKLRAFGRIAAAAKRRHPGLACHAANSSILLDFPGWELDMARVGNLLFGINPTRTEVPLRNPWSFYARIISLRTVAKGGAVGYASEFVAPRRMTVAAVPAGYSDGLTLEPAERLIGLGRPFHYWGLVRGRQAPFVGRTAISHALLDVSAAPRARVGDPVSLPIRRTAASSRIPRVYT